MKKIFVLVLQFLICTQAFSQQSFYGHLGDRMNLTADEFEGSIQWQISSDNMHWHDIAGGNTDPFEVIIAAVPSYFRASITRDNCPVHYSEIISFLDFNDQPGMLWSNPQTWGGSGKPVAGQVVSIPENMRIILDENPPPLGGLIIEGWLEFARKDVHLTAKYIMIMGGILQVGSDSEPFEQHAIITLNDENVNASIHGMGTRGIMVMEGALELHGKTPSLLWTKINASAPAGSNSLILDETVDWKVGDEIVVAPTDYYQAGNGASVTQRVNLTAINNNQQLTLSTGLNAYRWGVLQYATTSGVSLSDLNMVTPPLPDTPTKSTPLILDERAEVGNLTRNIVIQSPDDDLWKNQGFGAHVMIMGPESFSHVDGVEFRRAGQSGRLGRYAFHWHLASYNGTQVISDADGYLKNSSINSSANRGVVLHGTNGVLVQNNIIFDVKGHGIFTEDAVERRNTFDGNLVLHVRNPPAGQALKIHETGGRGASGFWISNPDNTIINNVAADCGTNGFWLAFPPRPVGLHSGVLGDDGQVLRPDRILFGTFDNNTAHSNRAEAIQLDRAEIDDAGNIFANRYYSTTDGQERVWPFPNQRRFTLSKSKVWKNFSNGSWVRALWVDEVGYVSADNCGRFFAGAGDEGVIERSLIIGTSLNHLMNGTGRPPTADMQFGYNNSTPTAFATYHSTFDIENNIVINFQAVNNDRSGAFATDDYYIRPVEKGHTRNTGNLLINSHPGVKLQPVSSEYRLASAIFDPNGSWGPPGNFFVFDDPFLTNGKTPILVPPGTGSGGVSVPGPYYGFVDFVLHGIGNIPPQNQPWSDLMGIYVRRLDNNLNEVATWEVTDAKLPGTNGGLGHMRHFATSPDGIYELTFPSEALHPTNFQMNVENMLTTNDTQVIGVQYDGALNPVVRMYSGNTYENYSSVSSLQEVRNSSGATYWQDKSNNRVWMKLRGGTWAPYGDPEALSDQTLYETTLIRIFVP